MTKTDSFANHCVQAEGNTENENSQQLQRETSSQSQGSTKLASPSNGSKRSTTTSGDYSNQMVVETSGIFEPTYACSLVDKMLMTAAEKISSQSTRSKLETRPKMKLPSMQLNYSRDVPCAATKSEQKQKQVRIATEPQLQSFGTKESRFFGSKAEFFDSLEEMQTTTFQDVSSQMVESDSEQATLNEVATVAESQSSTALSPNTSGDDSQSQQPIRFYANRLVVRAKSNVTPISDIEPLMPNRQVRSPKETLRPHSTTTQSDGFNGIPTLWDHSYSKTIQVDATAYAKNAATLQPAPTPASVQSTSLASKQDNCVPYVRTDDKSSTTLQRPSSSGMQSRTLLKTKQQNSVRTVPYTTKPTKATVVNSTAKAPVRKRTEILIQSNEIISMPTPAPPPIGSIIQTLPNSAVRIKPHQITVNPSTSKAAITQSAAAFKMRSKSNLKIPMKNEAIATPRSKALIATPKPRSVPVMNTLNFTAPKSKAAVSTPKSTPVIATSLKRKNNENDAPVEPTKLQKCEEPIQGTMPKIATSSTVVSLPDISIKRIVMFPASGMKFTLPADNSKPQRRSFSECVELLERNNVNIFRVPQRPLEKYLKMLEKNNVSFEPAIKK